MAMMPRAAVQLVILATAATMSVAGAPPPPPPRGGRRRGRDLQTTTDVPSPSPSPSTATTTTTLTIGGIAYSDLNLDGVRDVDVDVDVESPVPGVTATLYSCSTGAAVSTSTTDDDGSYALTTTMMMAAPHDDDGSGGGCYYVQFDAGDRAYFTSPANGETSDLYPLLLASTTTTAAGGDEIVIDDIDAGIVYYDGTYFPTAGPPGVDANAPTSSPAPSSSSSPSPSFFSSSTAAVTTYVPTTPMPASSEPTTIPPSIAPLSLESTILVVMSDYVVDPTTATTTRPSSDIMDDGAISTYEDVCGIFLNGQLAISTPPVYDLECSVVGQESFSSSSSSSSRRRRRRGRRTLAGDEGDSGISVETSVRGKSDPTSSAASMPSEEWFADLLVGTFNVQGYLFLEALREKEKEEVVGGGEDGYFGAVGEVRGAYAEEVASGNAGTGDGDVFSGVATILDNPILTHLHIGIIAGACAIALLLCCCCVRGIKRRSSSSKKFDDEHEVYEKAFPPISTGKAVGRTTTRGMADDAIVPEKKSGTWLGRKRSKDVNPPPSSTSSSSSAGRRSTNDRSGASSPGSVTSYIVADPSLDEVETGIQQVVTASSSSSSSSIQSPSSSETDDGARPIRRDVMAPKGKLGIVLANVFRPNAAGATRYGPAVFSLKDGSPMKGLLHERDVIVAINDVDTREYDVERLTQMMMDTSGRERKITVLSAHR